MEKTRVLGIFALALVLTLVSNVDAHHYYDYDRYDHYGNDHFSYHYDNYYGGAEIYVSIKDQDNWRSCYYHCWNSEDRVKRQAARWLVGTYNERYFANSGEKSKDVYCQGCDTEGSSTSFGNREIYNPYVDGKGSYRTGNYYDPEFDKEKGYWNWRY